MDLPGDATLEMLLQLHGEVFPMDDGFWTKFEAYRVEPDEHIPHGVRYSLTLHDRTNRRVLGFDNAHGFRPARKRDGARKTAWDHKHERETVVPYEFETAGQLLVDFWEAVEKLIDQVQR